MKQPQISNLTLNLDIKTKVNKNTLIVREHNSIYLARISGE